MGFGFTAEQSLLLSIPAGAVAVIALVGCGYLGDRYSNRLLFNSFGSRCGNRWHRTHPRLAPLEQGWETCRLLLDVCLLAALHGATITHLNQCCWPDQEDDSCSDISYCILCRAHNWYVIQSSGSNLLLTLSTGPQTFRLQDAPHYVPAEITIICCW